MINTGKVIMCLFFLIAVMALWVWSGRYVYIPKISNAESEKVGVSVVSEKYAHGTLFGVKFDTAEECVIWIKENVKEEYWAPEVVGATKYLKE